MAVPIPPGPDGPALPGGVAVDECSTTGSGEAAQNGDTPIMSNAPAPSAANRSPLLGLLVAQFFGAFNDNAFKMIVVLLAIGAAQAGD
jgi:hypothetical protein